MPKYHSTQQSNSISSIDISKPEGMSSFWKLIYNKNKKEGEQTVNKEMPKLNRFALKMLKLKGIDLDSFDLSNISSMKLEKNAVFNPAQIKLIEKDLMKGKVLFDAQILNTNNLRDNNNEHFKPFGLSTSISAASINSPTGRVKSSLPYLSLKKPQVFAFTNKKRVQLGKIDSEAFNKGLCSNSLTETYTVNTVPQASPKPNQKKKVIVVYFRKKKSKDSNKSINTENYSFNGNVNEELVSVESSPTSNATNSKEQSLNLATKSKEMENEIPKEPPLKNSPLSLYSCVQPQHIQPTAVKLLANKSQGKNISFAGPQTIKQNRKKDKDVFTKHPQTETNSSHTRDIFLDGLQNCVKTKYEQRNKREINSHANCNLPSLINPELLIKNHNLIIPEDLSKESLFQANPSAGCDTILYLFNSLSKKNHHCSEPNSSEMKSRERVHHQTISNTNYRNTNHETDRPINSDSVDTKNTVETSLKANHGKNSYEKNNEPIPRSIFSLPFNHDILRSRDDDQYESKPCESKLNKTNVSKRNIATFSNSLSTSLNPEVVDDCGVLGGASNKEGKGEMDTFQLNVIREKYEKIGLANKSQKLFKKTTISCPLKSPKQQVSITIQLDNKQGEDEQQELYESVSHNEEGTLPFVQTEEEINENLSSDLKNVHNEKGDGVDRKNEELFCLLGALSHAELGSYGRSNNSFEINPTYDLDQSLTNKNSHEKTELTGSTRKVKYLTRNQRKVFDEDILGVDYYEKSINLSSLKSKEKYKRTLPYVKGNSCTKDALSVPIVIFNSQESNKSYRCKTNTMIRRTNTHNIGRRVSKNKFFIETVSLTKTSKVSFLNDTSGINLQGETIPSFLKDKDELTDQQLVNLDNSNLTSNNGNQDSPINTDDLKARISKFNSTQSQESLKKQAETCQSPLKLNKDIYTSHNGIDQMNHKNISKRLDGNRFDLGCDRSSIRSGRVKKPFDYGSPIKRHLKSLKYVLPGNNRASKNGNHLNFQYDKDISSEPPLCNVGNSQPHVRSGGNVTDTSCLKKKLSNFQHKKLDSKNQISSYNNKLNELNTLQYTTDSEVFLENTIRNQDENSRLDVNSLCKSDQQRVGIFNPQNELSQEYNDQVQTESSKTMISNKTVKDNPCICCTTGCLAVMSDCSLFDNLE